jgi:hypothetical protein
MANQFNFEGLNRWKNINQSKKKKQQIEWW